MMTAKEKILDISLLLGAAAAILTAVFMGFVKDCEDLTENTFRLHIPANSDSLFDQRVKYALRDYLTEELEPIFALCGTKEQAKEAAAARLDTIESLANEFLEARGCGYGAKASIERAEFPTRMYAGFTLPAGTYDALKITLGKGEGKNWWCVLYPTLCLGAASVKEEFKLNELYERTKRSDELTALSLADRRGRIEIRFALYELFRSLFGGEA